jgi:hypothetical protein
LEALQTELLASNRADLEALLIRWVRTWVHVCGCVHVRGCWCRARGKRVRAGLRLLWLAAIVQGALVTAAM